MSDAFKREVRYILAESLARGRQLEGMIDDLVYAETPHTIARLRAALLAEHAEDETREISEQLAKKEAREIYLLGLNGGSIARYAKVRLREHPSLIGEAVHHVYSNDEYVVVEWPHTHGNGEEVTREALELLLDEWGDVRGSALDRAAARADAELCDACRQIKKQKPGTDAEIREVNHVLGILGIKSPYESATAKEPTK